MNASVRNSYQSLKKEILLQGRNKKSSESNLVKTPKDRKESVVEVCPDWRGLIK